MDTNNNNHGNNNNNVNNNKGPEADGTNSIVSKKKKEYSAKQLEVIDATKHSWKAYKKYGFGRDEIKPISKTDSTDNIYPKNRLIGSVSMKFLTPRILSYENETYWVIVYVVLTERNPPKNNPLVL